METRLCVVGKENGENKELMESIEVNKVIIWKRYLLPIVFSPEW